jgi:parallel beta-helix repeat protein
MKICNYIIIGFTIILFFNLLIPVIYGEESNILYVGYDKEFITIQDAINASVDNNTIIVSKGKYYENLEINKKIKLKGIDRFNTTIDASNKGNGISVSASEVNISNLSIINAKDTGIKLTNYISGIFTNCTFHDNIIKDCTFGMKIQGSINSKFYNNIIKNSKNAGLMIFNFQSKTRDIRPNIQSTNNFIFQNDFVNNTLQVYDEGNNSWSFNGKGNYYDNYSSTDLDNDGIWDEPFVIPTLNESWNRVFPFVQNIDEYPLVNPYNPYFEEKSITIDLIIQTMIIGLIIAVIVLIPIALYWRKKYFM